MAMVKVSARGTNLGTRSDGREIRNEIINEINKGEKVFLDFSDVDLISGSFADECLGIMIAEHGFNFVKSNISIKNSNPSVTLVLKQAMKNRLRIPESRQELSPIAS
ncbi:MAG: STAS-like domain-containing protein [Schwartzia sp.]|nr:STAS-like domain-containing protein [Schwartzia sp. (in: firmicutes)]MBR1761062.1 STAS-like domain-containing protein [Schwartzia sp. (in: firmicutes)]